MEFSFELTSGKIQKSTKDSAAFDLFYAGTKPLFIGDRPVAISTGVKTKFTPGLVAIIKEKSGLALKGIELKAGVIDADYRDEWLVVARNPIQCLLSEEPTVHSITPDPEWKPFRLNPGEKIAQFFLIELPKVHYYALDGADLVFLDAVRAGGFGSTDNHAPLTCSKASSAEVPGR
jgi:dUTPase